ncbi:MAG: S26 family signal peptidase [Clostridia bacterium]|nr:S26 family signal peptidase [Clostridia bacterium]
MSIASVGNIEKILERDGVYPSVTEGISMRPLFKTHRDMVILERVSGKLKKYDVALYKKGEKYILHRVIGIDDEKNVYIIRGDNTYKKEYVPMSSVIARLTSFKRKGKSHTVDEKPYRIYAVFWNFIYPIRYLFHLARCVLVKIYRALFKKRGKR